MSIQILGNTETWVESNLAGFTATAGALHTGWSGNGTSPHRGKGIRVSHKRVGELPVGHHRLARSPEVDQLAHVVLEQEIVGSCASTFAALATLRGCSGKFTETLGSFAQAGIQGEVGKVWDGRCHGAWVLGGTVDTDQRALVDWRGNGQSLTGLL